MKNERIIQHLKGSLVVSCQPVDGGPMDKVEHVVAMALAAINGGAKAVRIEGVDNVSAVASQIDQPVIGIVKQNLIDSDVRITPFVGDVMALSNAGADVIAFDGTDRVRPCLASEVLQKINQCGRVAMADCANYEQGIALHKQGCQLIGSTLSGYMKDEQMPLEPDFELVKNWSNAGICVVAEGRYHSPALAAEAIKMGAWCVTVGSAITRIEHITRWFDDAMINAKLKQEAEIEHSR